MNIMEISKIIKLANLIGFGVVPYAGGSGLVGGQIPMGTLSFVIGKNKQSAQF